MRIEVLFILTLLVGCATKPSVHDTAKLASDLRVTSTTTGHLRAKLRLMNAGPEPIAIEGPSLADFHVETKDGKALAFKGPRTPGAPLRLQPGESVETTFELQERYPFWDRRTKYRIWFDAPFAKSNVDQVWF